MVLWWIGNAILLVAILPVVIYLLNRVLAAVERIRGATDNILAGGVALIGELNGLPEALAVPLRRGAPAVVGRLEGGRLLLDLRSLLPEQDEPLVAAILAAARA